MKASARLLWVLLVAVDSRAEEPPPAAFSHFATILDDSTWQAIADSSFVQGQLARTEVKQTQASIGSWTGLYLIGENTYVELFKQSARPPGAAGRLGELVLSSEQVGGLDVLLLALVTKWPGYGFAKQAIAKADRKPWFTVIEARVEGLAIDVGVMEYEPRYLDSLTGTLPAKGPADVRRARRTSELFNPDLLLKDVVGITLALGPENAKVLDAILSTSGYQKHVAPKGGVVDYFGPKVRIRVQRAGVLRGIVAIDLSLTRAPVSAARVYRFGPKSTLTLDGQSGAVWSFQ